MGNSRAENKLSGEQGHNHKMKLLPLLPGFPSSKCLCSVCVCVSMPAPLMAFQPAGLFQPSLVGMEVQRHPFPTRQQTCKAMSTNVAEGCREVLLADPLVPLRVVLGHVLLLQPTPGWMRFVLKRQSCSKAARGYICFL